MSTNEHKCRYACICVFFEEKHEDSRYESEDAIGDAHRSGEVKSSPGVRDMLCGLPQEFAIQPVVVPSVVLTEPQRS